MIVSMAGIRQDSSVGHVFSDLNFSGLEAIWSGIFTITLFSVTTSNNDELLSKRLLKGLFFRAD